MTAGEGCKAGERSKEVERAGQRGAGGGEGRGEAHPPARAGPCPALEAAIHPDRERAACARRRRDGEVEGAGRTREEATRARCASPSRSHMRPGESTACAGARERARPRVCARDGRICAGARGRLGCACACARGTVATPLPFHELALVPPAVGPGVDVGVKSAVKRAVKRVVEREVDSADDCRSESTRPSQLVKWSAGLLTGWCA